MTDTSEVAFPRDEFESRLTAARACMARAGLDVLVACAPENFYYLSGYESTGHFAVQALLVPSGGLSQAQRFEAYLRCGIPAHGFTRLRCANCASEHRLPFSCKRRGFCPSCGGRRMAPEIARLAAIRGPRTQGRATGSCLPAERPHRRPSHRGHPRFRDDTRVGFYSWARYYHPGLGRFVSENPIQRGVGHHAVSSVKNAQVGGCLLGERPRSWSSEESLPAAANRIRNANCIPVSSSPHRARA